MCLSAMYLSVWLYELGNWVSLSATGAHASIVLSGVLPVAVMGDASEGPGFSVAKVLQVGICVGITLVAFNAARRMGLPLTSLTLVSVTSMYIASMYWELFSLTSFVPMTLHESIYVVLSVALTFGFLRVFPVVPFSKRSTQVFKQKVAVGRG